MLSLCSETSIQHVLTAASPALRSPRVRDLGEAASAAVASMTFIDYENKNT